MPRACLLLLIRSCLAWSACHHRAVLRAAAFPLDRQDPGLGALPAAGVDWWAWARPRLNRRERRLRTDQFNAPWRGPNGCRRSGASGSRVAVTWRRPTRRLFEQQRRTWTCTKRPGWHGWPCRGRRIGEAANPGPAAMDVDTAGSRIFCPVPSCPSSAGRGARGWASHSAMRPHLDDHAAGQLAGAVPQDYLHSHGLDTCTECGLLLSQRYNGVHPRCRPAARAAMGLAAVPHGEADLGPDIAQVCAAGVPVLRHVPKAARGVWAQCLARALAAVATTNSMAAWGQLLMLPKAVLMPAPRGGAKRREQAARFTSRRCARWLAGERLELWPEGQGLRRKRRAGTSEDERSSQQLRCRQLAAEGELSRACAALVAPALVRHSPGVMDKLRAKHPRAQPARAALLPLGPPARTDVPDIAAADVVAAVRSFRRGSAAGPSGLRDDHLREALGSAHGDEVAAHLAEVVQLLVRGDAPLEIAPHMAGAALHALPKPGGDVRPIAVGETLRRLASKCLCQAVREPAQRWLSPLQLGVAVSLGAEAAVHTARNWFHRNSGHANKAFLTIDFENAFNSVDRAAMLREVRLRLPGLAPYAEWCYGHHSRLLFDGEPLTSEAGVQQGDPLGPLLFSLAVQPALRAVRSGPWDQQPELAFAYLDDVCLAGSLPQHCGGPPSRLGAQPSQVQAHHNIPRRPG